MIKKFEDFNNSIDIDSKVYELQILKYKVRFVFNNEFS